MYPYPLGAKFLYTDIIIAALIGNQSGKFSSSLKKKKNTPPEHQKEKAVISFVLALEVYPLWFYDFGRDLPGAQVGGGKRRFQRATISSAPA